MIGSKKAGSWSGLFESGADTNARHEANAEKEKASKSYGFGNPRRKHCKIHNKFYHEDDGCPDCN